MMSNAKVVVTKEVSEALEYLRSKQCRYRDVSYYIAEHARTTFDDEEGWAGFAEPLNELDVATFARALLNGYEVEKTPEEKVREYFLSYGRSISAMERRKGVIDTLNLLGITIEGVND